MTNLITVTNPLWFEAVGVLGFALYVLNYSLLAFNKINSDQPIYFTLNLGAASFVLVGLLVSFNLASALIQLSWVAISLTAIFMRWMRPVGATPSG